MKVLITGGAGFIGSHITQRFVQEGHTVRVIDNLSSGRQKFLEPVSSKVDFLRLDLTEYERLKAAMAKTELVIHCAAQAEVLPLEKGHHKDFQSGIQATYLLLEAMRACNVRQLIFLSSSAVYGEADQKPTNEGFGPLKPISTYAAAKIAAEALCSSYAHSLKMRLAVYRLANIVGSNSSHGVILKFCQQLQQNPEVLHVLGNGQQKKSYVHISDCIDGIFKGWNQAKEFINYYNLSNQDTLPLDWIAQEVCRQFKERRKLQPRIEYAGGDRAWPEDVPHTELDSGKLAALGWVPKLNSQSAAQAAIEEIFNELGI